MQLETAVRRRRMVRSYLPDPGPRDSLERILGLARRAPSAGFSQGVHFVVVTDAATRRAVATLADEPRHVAAGRPPWLSAAPAHIVVCVREADYRDRYAEADKAGSPGPEQWPVPYWWVDAGAALMLLLLGAVDEGLGAGFFGAHRLPGLARLLGLPGDVVPLGVVTVGRPAAAQPQGSARRGRRPAAEVVHWERWDQSTVNVPPERQ